MSETAVAKEKAGAGTTLRLSDFERVAGELKRWRASDDLRIIQATKGSALVLPFVKGLRLSAHLIYVLRMELSHTDLEVDWGHLLDAREESCSPECDVIIHRKGYIRKWNGSDRPIMDFRFVQHASALAVVSCKSYAKDVDADYVKKLQPYVKHVLLFAECCAPNQVDSLRKKAKNAGYAGFWFLYTYDEPTNSCVTDPSGWLSFLRAIRSRVDKAARKK